MVFNIRTCLLRSRGLLAVVLNIAELVLNLHSVSRLVSRRNIARLRWFPPHACLTLYLTTIQALVLQFVNLTVAAVKKQSLLYPTHPKAPWESHQSERVSWVYLTMKVESEGVTCPLDVQSSEDTGTHCASYNYSWYIPRPLIRDGATD
ncbi:hypothetical protein RRG08_009344 [Elysia crispata]|uniref:Uncharacterized protein n=1 Tax=Elysia crispata TaxID=231223 RepID=A0AAE1CSC9_9GAST|nr:hypothetical protein RRG08_009344 [Elysia crispata]